MCIRGAGIYYSDDKLLQTRIFSYPDTQRHRLGPNYLLLPANAPKSAHHNNHHDGFMNFTHRDEEVRVAPVPWRGAPPCAELKESIWFAHMKFVRECPWRTEA